ncbi:sensor histidine kinase [Halopiger goleimassiliensis]|uniref:sensor histidine kinase n=1 Tax=Halopiger goleimassiliensis TaxID=1293048 RepID=UPI000677F120|nr:PAS domain-containing sensor histidine kinase [Halopiger goleimassiliensis]
MDRHCELSDYVGAGADVEGGSISAFFEQLVEGVGVGIGAVGSHGEFVYVNERYAEMIEEPRSTLLGRCVGEVNPAFDQSAFEDYWSSFTTGETRIYETVHRTATGEEFPVRVHVTRVDIADTEFNVGTIRDISELERRREQLEVLRRVLRHDLRNRLNVVAGYTNLIEVQLENDDDLRNHFDRIQTEIEHLLATSENSRRLEELLDSARSRSEVKRTEIRLDHLLEDAVTTTQEKFPDAAIEYANPGEIRVRAAKYLGQAVTHVLSNAVIHNDTDEPRVAVDARRADGRAIVSIADNGPGIPDDRKDLVFGREERDQLHHGRGFGLFFVANVVEESGGEIWIEDNDPRGAVFNVALPTTSESP